MEKKPDSTFKSNDFFDALYEIHKIRQSDPDVFYKAEMEQLKQTLIGFYNLYIKAGPVYDRNNARHKGFDYTKAPFEKFHEVEKTFPDEIEQTAITEFMKGVGPAIVSALAYQERQGHNWYESDGFMRWVDDYHYMRKLVDEYMAGTKSINTLQWLASRLVKREPVLKVKNNKEEWVNVQKWRGGSGESVDLGNHSIKTTWDPIFTDKQKYYYGMPEYYTVLSNMFYTLRNMLEECWEIRKCGAKDCENIYIPDRKNPTRQIYCSSRCRNRIGKRRERQKMLSAAN